MATLAPPAPDTQEQQEQQQEQQQQETVMKDLGQAIDDDDMGA